MNRSFCKDWMTRNGGANQARRAAFSLLELSVVILIIGVIAGVALSLKQSSGEDCVGATKAQMKDIQGAMERFVNQNERYPLPALRTAGVEDVKYGREVTHAELAANPSLLDATTPPVTTPPTSSVTFGALPFQALGLAPSYAGDCWGNKFTYAVTTDLTETGKFNQQLPLQTYEGVITVKADLSTAPVSVKAAYVAVSHGANALGAVKVNYRSSTGEKRFCALGSTLDSENCEPSNAVYVAAAYNDGKDAGAKFFDDIVIFSDKKQRSISGVCNNALPNSCTVGLATNDNGLTACGTTRTWTCKGSNGGIDASCAFSNPACPVAPPICIADGQPSGGNPASCCNGDSDGNGTCGTQSCPAGQQMHTDGCCHDVIVYGGSDGNCVQDISSYCTGSNTHFFYSVCGDCVPAVNCGSNPPPACTADGQPSGGNPASCCNGDADGNGTCGTQAAPAPSCTPCATFVGVESFRFGSQLPGADTRACWDITRADCSVESDTPMCGGFPSGMTICPTNLNIDPITLDPVLSLSDLRLKTDIVQVASRKDFNIYEFSYRDDDSHTRYRGVMAQEVMGIPNAVVAMPSGYYAVNYAAVGVQFEKLD